MFWTLEMAEKLEDAPWPASKNELIHYATQLSVPFEIIENLQELEENGRIYNKISEIWPDYPQKGVLFALAQELCGASWYRSKDLILELISKLEGAPHSKNKDALLTLASNIKTTEWLGTKEDFVDIARGLPINIIKNFLNRGNSGVFNIIEEVWPEYTYKDDAFLNKDKYYDTSEMRDW